jgi:hypothetical protein
MVVSGMDVRVVNATSRVLGGAFGRKRLAQISVEIERSNLYYDLKATWCSEFGSTLYVISDG